jgi:hypothetical protein
LQSLAAQIAGSAFALSLGLQPRCVASATEET